MVRQARREVEDPAVEVASVQWAVPVGLAARAVLAGKAAKVEVVVLVDPAVRRHQAVAVSNRR